MDKSIEENLQQNISDDKIHPWRICPIGKHFVKKHKVRTHPSKEHPNGEVIEINDHCALNPSKKDVLSFDEIQAMTEKYFHQLSGPPKAGVPKGYTNVDKFDVEIRDWTRIGMIFFLFQSHFLPI